VRIEDFQFQLLSRIPADTGGAEIGSIHFLLATINIRVGAWTVYLIFLQNQQMKNPESLKTK
jgi:hypothetical protein